MHLGEWEARYTRLSYSRAECDLSPFQTTALPHVTNLLLTMTVLKQNLLQRYYSSKKVKPNRFTKNALVLRKIPLRLHIWCVQITQYNPALCDVLKVESVSCLFLECFWTLPYRSVYYIKISSKNMCEI